MGYGRGNGTKRRPRGRPGSHVGGCEVCIRPDDKERLESTYAWLSNVLFHLACSQGYCVGWSLQCGCISRRVRAQASRQSRLPGHATRASLTLLLPASSHRHRGRRCRSTRPRFRSRKRWRRRGRRSSSRTKPHPRLSSRTSRQRAVPPMR
jgi:hypothetical protein